MSAPAERDVWGPYLDSLEERRDLYGRMEEVVCEQVAAIAGSPEADPLGWAHAQRELQGRIEGLDRLLEGWEGRLPPDPAREERRSTVREETRQVLERLLALQERALGVLRGSHDAVSGRLKRIHAGRSAVHAYARNLRKDVSA
ncbi:MAG: hypothetical protein HY608_02240 [Planctomycetes bacterium]|nr:hypothetical protein [Planctomycetota bacterium]